MTNPQITPGQLEALRYVVGELEAMDHDCKAPTPSAHHMGGIGESGCQWCGALWELKGVGKETVIGPLGPQWPSGEPNE